MRSNLSDIGRPAPTGELEAKKRRTTRQGHVGAWTCLGGHGLPWCGQFAGDEKNRTSTASHWPHATASGIKEQLFWVGAPGLLGNRFRQGDSRLKVCR